MIRSATAAIALALVPFAPLSAQEAPSATAAASAEATGPGSFSDLVKAKAPAVVGIVAERTAEPEMGLEPRFRLPPGLRDFFGGPLPDMPEEDMPPLETPQALGSGFILTEDGLVVTNNHVVQGAESVRVVLEDGREFEAEIVGTDPATDLALLRARGVEEPLPHLDWGDSDAVEVGDWVVAIGNPFGLGGTVTAGILSARSRDINVGPYDDFLQTDASINRGNSGGPLFDESGQVIGVNTAIFSPTGGNVGIGFATPSNVAEAVIRQLSEEGRVSRGYLGVTIQTLDERLASALGLDAAEGALVSDVSAGAPAAAAGVRTGDVIVSVAGEPIEDARGLSRAVAAIQPGETVDVTVMRDGDRRTLEVEIAERPTDLGMAPAEPEAPAAEPSPLGAAVSTLTDDLRDQIGAPASVEGLFVGGVEPGGPAAEAGLREGDVIVSAGGDPVQTVEALRERVGEAREAGRALLLRYWRDGGYAFAAAPVAAG